MSINTPLNGAVAEPGIAWSHPVLLFIALFLSAFAPVIGMPQKDTSDVLQNIEFRNIGPAAAGGRVSAVVGIAGQPNIYYVGAAGGGVFKTIDGGISWKSVFDKEPCLSIGAIALAPSNPNYVWVGTGEANLRNDIITGKGVYFSPDAGKSWESMGLKDAGQISRIVIDPTNPNVVFVGVIGHAWGANPDRGVFRTSDGGITWDKVLYVNDTTGASDLVMDPGNPKVLFAAMWQVMRYPWALNDGGTGSGIYRSTDGGTTWKHLTEGLPKGPLGRIALAAAPSDPNHIYTLVESKEGMLWDSKDLGDNWNMITNNHTLDVRPFYFSRFVVSPENEDRLFFLSFLISESTDGGKTVKSVNGRVHVDHHDIWIDPSDPNRIIIGNDGGVYLSADQGQTWRFLNNLPIEQFYEVATDDSNPYNLGGGLQDNNAWYGTSNNLYGGSITGQNWYTVAGGDGEYVVPAPSNPDIVYAESQNGWLSRINVKTGISRDIRPYLYDAPDMPPSRLKYRFNWTTPIAVSLTNENEVFLGANVLFKTDDGGQHWDVIGPDLTRNDKSKQIPSGGKVNLDISGAENYDTILSIAISPLDSNVIWVGTDDGLVQVTRDGGKSWDEVAKNVSHLPEWGRVYQVAPSPIDNGGCYIAVDRHELDDNKPYVFKTADYGKSWTSISTGLPADDPVHVVREDPNRKGFLVAGTDAGMYYSTDNGREWNQFRTNFPSVSVYDLKFVKQTHDLIAATHGRGIFIMDNISNLEQLNEAEESDAFHLSAAIPSYAYHVWGKDAFNDLSTYSAPNPPHGVIIDYYLKDTLSTTKSEKSEHETPVKIEIKDTSGTQIATLYGPAKKGFNRFVWNMRYQSPVPLKIGSAEESHANPFTTSGPLVSPGMYKIVVSAAGVTQSTDAQVLADPRFEAPVEYFTSNARSGLEARTNINALNELLNRTQSLQDQIATIKKSLATDEEGTRAGKYKSISSQLDSLGKSIASIKDSIYNGTIQHEVGEDDIHAFTDFHSSLTGIMYAFMSPYDGPPSDIALEMLTQLTVKLSQYLNKFNDILTVDIPSFNRSALAEGTPTIFAGPVIELKK